MVLFGKDFAFQNATQEFSQMSPLVDWISEHGMKLDPPMRIKYATGEKIHWIQNTHVSLFTTP